MQLHIFVLDQNNKDKKLLALLQLLTNRQVSVTADPNGCFLVITTCIELISRPRNCRPGIIGYRMCNGYSETLSLTDE